MKKEMYVDQIAKNLLEAKFTLKDIKIITYRTINYWDEKGFLLRKRRKTEKGWRRFSLIEFLWIKLLDELREHNISIEEKAPILFKAVGYDLDLPKTLETAQLNFLSKILPCITEKKSIRLNIFSDTAKFELTGEPTNESDFENYVSISINRLLIDFISIQKSQKINSEPFLSENEEELINLFDDNNIEELAIFKGSEASTFTNFEKNRDSTLYEILKLIFKPYSEVTYKTKGGKTVKFNREYLKY